VIAQHYLVVDPKLMGSYLNPRSRYKPRGLKQTR
jgi:hypothetical protein